MKGSLKRQRADSQASKRVLRSRLRIPVYADNSPPSTSASSRIQPDPDLLVIAPPPRPRALPRVSVAQDPLDTMADDASFIESMGSDVVTIFTGAKRSPETKKFTVHRNLVCSASDVLKEQLRIQATTLAMQTFKDELYFNKDNPIDAQDFVNLLYRNRQAVVDRVRTYGEYLQLYQFADRYNVDGLRDIAIDGLQDRMGDQAEVFEDLYDVKRVFGYTSKSPNNRLYRFYTAMLAYTHLELRIKDKDTVMQEMEAYPDLLEDWLAFQQTEHEKPFPDRLFGTDPRIRVLNPRNVDGFPICYFHVHPPEQKCPTKANQEDEEFL